MYWIKYKKTSFLLFSLAFLLGSCNSSGKEEKDLVSEEKNKITETTVEQQIIRKIESKLEINAKEDYTVQFFYNYINTDTLKDRIVLVNRKEHAIEHYKKNNSENFLQNIGYTAPYNYVFVQLGGTDKLISTTPIGSNVNYPVTIEFLELTSKAKKDFYIEYRIRNSLHRNYYSLHKGELNLAFACPVFDKIGEKEPLVYKIEHKDSPLRIAKDIALFYGRFSDYNPSEIKDNTIYSPKEIISTDKLFAYFIYDENKSKYVTPMRPEGN